MKILQEPKSSTHLVDIPQPFGDALETLSVRYVVDQHYTHSTSIVGRCDRVEPLLAGGVPVIGRESGEQVNETREVRMCFAIV